MSKRVLSILNPDNGRYTITVNSDEILLLISKIREIVKKEVHSEYRKKLTEEFLTRDEVTDLFKITKAVLDKWNRTDFLIPVKVGGKTLYKRSDVMKIVYKRDNGKKRRKMA